MTSLIDTPAATDSLAARIQQRRAALLDAKQVTVPVHGYRDLLAATYRQLTFEEKRRISLRHQGIGSNADDEVQAAADMLVTASEDLLARNGDDYESLGCKWSPEAISRLFGLSIPDGVTARSALMLALTSDQIMEHFGAYIEAVRRLEQDAEAAAVGESTAPSGAQ